MRQWDCKIRISNLALRSLYPGATTKFEVRTIPFSLVLNNISDSETPEYEVRISDFAIQGMIQLV